MSDHYLKLLPKVKALVFDVDGVFTDGSMFIMPGMEVMRSLNARDTYSVRRAVDAGLHIGVITRGRSEDVKKGLEMVGVQDISLGAMDKWDVLETWKFSYDWDLSEVLYMGDDIPDIDVLKHVGVPCCPSDAVQEVQDMCKYISPFEGGKGCVRDVIEKVMKAQDLW
tara:strand:+ start:442 stop:942 length:501 start_codon:yes stop_codon:yes gene_type:complete